MDHFEESLQENIGFDFARLTEEQLQQTEQFRKSHVPPCNILRFFREQDVGCAFSSQKIYNVVAKIKRNRMQERNTTTTYRWALQQIKHLYFTYDIPEEHDRDMESEMRDLTLLLQEISTGPISNAWEVRRLIKGVIHLVLPDDPCQPLSTPLETVFTKGRRKTNSTKRDKSHWEYVSIAHKKIGKSSGSGSGSGNGSSSGSNPSPRGRGRPPRSGRIRGRGRSTGRSNLSSVVSPDSPPVPFSFKNAFPEFMYQFIQNWKNIVGDGNCGFRVVSNFLFGDENHWVEIHRRMSYDLRHRMHVYEQLFGSVERVTELIMKTKWEEGSAPPEYWIDIPDHLYVIANTFNLCIVFLTRSESTTVLPLVSNMNGPSGTIFMGLIEELQHFIQL
ncbi:hypothetical protein M9H77_11806 [Catharanthus roseus]|uniref:Uncharacterized protein n=1 Tax=Catharanthus roseus TaxID=4058 RepID=A0ACC0BFS5_CATRO|nr:hypothetical protein M9H77_11806 [Catharanthus roseus]